MDNSKSRRRWFGVIVWTLAIAAAIVFTLFGALSDRALAAAALGGIAVIVVGGVTVCLNSRQKQDVEADHSEVGKDVIDINKPSREDPVDLNDLMKRVRQR